MRLVVAATALFLAACSPSGGDTSAPKVAPILTGADAVDGKTYARPQEARVVHVDLELDLDFDQQLVAGTVMLDLIAQEDAQEVVLDSKGLEIESITDGEGRPLEWELGEEDGEKGAPLTVQIGETRELTIAYSAKDADSLQWLTPEQTAGGKHPFVFSQGQEILNRTWIPTQDSPGIRQTWSARITAPVELTVVMSGLSQGEPEDAGDGRRSFAFEMDKPVAPYLIAIAAGDIVHRDLGERSGVWAEPSIIEAAVAELQDTEKMIDAAEKLYGPYRWGRYDMIVLPPAFPYGGMENPVMTFLTPTFIAGDRSLTGLIAHELAHSWSGNLVTNAVWGDSWLNEGVTSYFENRIVEEIYGKERAEQEAALSFQEIEDALEEKGATDPGTALHQKVGDYELGSGIAYDKGSFFLRTLERQVGRERFDAWLRQWFDKHAFQPATSAMIYEDLKTNLAKDEAEAEALMLREWIYEPGLPSNVARPDPKAFAEVDAAVAAYSSDAAIPAAAWKGWTAAEQQRFLRNLPAEQTGEALAKLDRELGLSKTGNNELRFLWLKLALDNRYQPAVPLAEEFMGRIGRAKFIRPLFQTLVDEGAWGMAIAQPLYAKTRGRYHSFTQGEVDKLFAKGG
ncbi:M1 family metallopeptidase [Altererythrobacter arenosus]|uniref:Aminopeptidase N n=1 Tax=Altererythrobacter arenosus TaxID=3032592 RepID=A0ABY8FRW1_9SPHN|nr:M1 family metallopeptidase [Altererythrobacter sp. CAU 1644]WFL77745.1 M1 family metallopeptidase [Altererythrobacter sp. CAU 1644]